jgi:hypothetical protein
MKQLLGLCLTLFMTTALFGQLELPQKSPKASTSYVVGLTKVTIEYSSPSVNDRVIWGDLIAYDKIWRAGANEATTVEFSTDVKVVGKPLAKGKYSLFFIPKAEGKWEAVFNKVADQWGVYSYDEKQDALRVEVQTKEAKSSEERLTFAVVDRAADRGYIRFGWEKKRVYILFRADLLSQVADNVKVASEAAEADKKWSVHSQAADWYLENGHTEKALAEITTSIGIAKHSRNCWIEAKVKAAMEDYKGAVESATVSLELGEKAQSAFYKNSKDRIEKSLADWKSKP